MGELARARNVEHVKHGYHFGKRKLLVYGRRFANGWARWPAVLSAAAIAVVRNFRLIATAVDKIAKLHHSQGRSAIEHSPARPDSLPGASSLTERDLSP